MTFWRSSLCGDAGQPTVSNTPEPDEVSDEALAALLANDNSGNETVMQVTVSITIALLAYLPLSATLASESANADPRVIPLLGVPVVLLQLYQLILATSVMRRAASAELLESTLVVRAGLDERREKIGSQADASVMNVERILSDGGPGAVPRLLGALIPYLGFYALGLAHSAFVLYLGYVEVAKGDSRAFFWVGLVVTVSLWLVFFEALVAHYAAWCPSPISLSLVALAAVFLQFVDEDPLFPLYYLTTVCAVLVGCLRPFARGLKRGQFLGHIYLSAAIGCVLSGVVFALAILPRNGLGHDQLTVTANVLLHFLLPLMVLGELVVFGVSLRTSTWFMTLAVPAIYLVFSVVSQLVWGAKAPYEFLDAERPGLIVPAALGFAVLARGLVAGLIWWTRRTHAVR